MRARSNNADHIRVIVVGDRQRVPTSAWDLDNGNAVITGRFASFSDRAISCARSGADVVVVHLTDVASLQDLPSITAIQPTVVVSRPPPDATLVACVAAGAAAFVVESAASSFVAHAVASVAEGHLFVDPTTLEWCLDAAARFQSGTSLGDARISPRQAEVLALVYQGLTNDEIAVALRLSTNTVKTHLMRAMRRLRAPDRHSAAETARSLAMT